MRTVLTDLLGIEHPIIQAPMAGGPSTPELAAAVSNAGGLGSLGAAYLTPEALRRDIAAVRRLTDRPFGVNLFLPESAPLSDERLQRALALLAPYRDELGLPPLTEMPPDSQADAQAAFAALLGIVLEERAPVFSFTFGVLATEHLRALKGAGITVIGTATTVAEGVALAAVGVDAVVGQGFEAGGHHGSFQPDEDYTLRSFIGTMALVPQLVDAVEVPVIAAGGIMDGRGLVAALALGAAAVQMGTAFLACAESGAHPLHKAALLASTEERTVLTRAFSGRSARGLANRFTEELRPHEAELAPFPAQNTLTRGLRQAAAAQSRAEFLSMWAGQASRLATARPAAEVVRDVAGQARQVLERFSTLE